MFIEIDNVKSMVTDSETERAIRVKASLFRNEERQPEELGVEIS